MNKYQWKIALTKDVDPDKVVRELEKIAKVENGLTPENIVEFAKNEKTQLHKLFEWDDTRAAEKYRIIQARTILNNIEVKVISDGEERQIDVYEVIRKEDGNIYKNIAAFDADDIIQVKVRIVRELNQLKKKLSFYKEFELATQKIQDAIEFLGK